MRGMGDILRQAQLMQSKMAKAQEELARQTVEGTSGGGMVRVTCTGKQEVLSLVIDKSVVDPDDVELLQDLVQAAINDALRQSREMMEREMSVAAGGLKIPGFS